ncbi:MAG: PilT/PilU family type 4a pilus ATPase [Planctomycetota bacterium]|nr:PilT/PilU family type 4a pilus ATPase [Planctomycetota bacterium]
MKPSSIHQPIDEHDQRAGSHDDKAPKLARYFQAMIKAGASDLHLRAGSPPHIRTKTKIRPSKSKPLTADEVSEMALELLTPKQKAFFDEHGSIDVAHELEGADRFRMNIYRQRGSVAISVRRVTRQIPDFESLHLPPVLGKIAEARHGLILLSGATGSGKSTTIASMLEHINKTRPCHIVTLEDPIEYLFEDKKSLVSQREIGIDVDSFASALKYLMREDPDVVLIGEMRDHETFQAALQASETGHLVFGTVHASSAPQTIGRILDLFPPDSRGLIRQSLAFNLRAIVCQKLLPGIAEGVDRVPAVEILLRNPSVCQLIAEGRETELHDVIRANEQEGMKSFTQSLLELIEKDYVDPKVAYAEAPNADELKMLMKGIVAGQPRILGH